MRPSLLNHRRSRRRERRERHVPPVCMSEPGGTALHLSADCDPAVERVRSAGGPIDHAAYACQCGYVFSADVSTSVLCPHCGAEQVW
jgi:hypothetical protein